MAETYTEINLPANQKADRKLEMHYVNIGTSEEPEWEILGYGVEDASMSYNHDVSTTVDILGISHTEVSAAKPQLDLDPYNIRGGDKLSAKLLDIERRNAVSELSQFEVLNVHAFLGSASAFDAELHTGCTIVPQSLGGSSYVGMPLNVHLSNQKTLGTATITSGNVTFSPASADESSG